jgi:hypothetical protein
MSEIEPPQPPPKARRGPKPGSTGAPANGFDADPERARRAGLVGGARVRELYGPEHYQRLEKEGGRKLVRMRGKVHFAAIEKAGGTNKAAAVLKRKHGST